MNFLCFILAKMASLNLIFLQSIMGLNKSPKKVIIIVIVSLISVTFGRQWRAQESFSTRDLQFTSFIVEDPEDPLVVETMSVRPLETNNNGVAPIEGELAALASQFSSQEAEYVIVVLKNAEALTKLKAICSQSQEFFKTAQKRYGWQSVCHMEGQCVHIYEHAIFGVYGQFTWQNLVQLSENCLQDDIDYFEVDLSVEKAEEAPSGENEDLGSNQLISISNDERDGPNKSDTGSSPTTEELQNTLQDVALVNTTNNSSQYSKQQSPYAKSQFVWDGSSHTDLTNAEMKKMVETGHYAAEFIDSNSKTWHPDSLFEASLGEQLSQEGIEAQAIGYKTLQIPEAFWNLDRIDQRLLPLNGKYTYGGQRYIGTGREVTIYVIDSGIRSTHNEFQDKEGKHSRAFTGADFVDLDGLGEDCDGHGTHVASTAVGRFVGVAKEARAVGVRVLDCRGLGRVGNLIAGIDWVLDNLHGPSVAALSLGIKSGVGSRALKQAVQTMSKDYDVTTVVAAGNSGMDSCDIVPANIPETITVAASDLVDKFKQTQYDGLESIYRYSNTGECVDIFAPGVAIYAACGGKQRCDSLSDSEYTWADGTSMAVPHVAGAAAVFLGEVPTAKPSEVKAVLTGLATTCKIQDSNMLPNTPNRLLYVNLEEMMDYYYKFIASSSP